MENNKPEWLRKAEEEIAKFNETKWANYTDSQLASVNGLRINGIENRHAEGKTKRMIEKGQQTKKENGYYESEAFSKKQSKLGLKGGAKSASMDYFKKDFIEAGVKASLKQRAIDRHEKYVNVLNSIKKESFSSKEIKTACSELGYKKNIDIRDLIKHEYVYKVHEGIHGSKVNVTLYKKI